MHTTSLNTTVHAETSAGSSENDKLAWTVKLLICRMTMIVKLN